MSNHTLSVSYTILVPAKIMPQAFLNALPLAEMYNPFPLTLYKALTDTGHGRMAEWQFSSKSIKMIIYPTFTKIHYAQP
jgi:hypothetical protein